MHRCAQLEEVEILMFQDSMLSGTLPVEVRRHLRELLPPPACIGQLTHSQFVSCLHTESLTRASTLLPQLGEVSELDEFSVSLTRVSGTIPPSIGKVCGSDGQLQTLSMPPTPRGDYAKVR